MTNIYYVRHGQTDFNLKRIMYGKIDADLNPTGIEQAKATGLMLKDMHFDVIYCSDLKRAQQTCAQINAYHNLPVILDSRLQERGYGEIENTPEDTNGFDKRESWDWNTNKVYTNGVENIRDLYKRVEAALNDIIRDNKDKNILIVAHRGVGRCVRVYFEGLPADGNIQHMGMENAAVAHFTVE